MGLLCDRDIQENGVEVEFFSERVTMPRGPATLALRTEATLVAAACYSGPGRDHFAAVTPPIDAVATRSLREDVQRVTQALTIELEGLIRAPRAVARAGTAIRSVKSRVVIVSPYALSAYGGVQEQALAMSRVLIARARRPRHRARRARHRRLRHAGQVARFGPRL